MNYLLSTHEKGYQVSFSDACLSASTLFSGAPYAARHWELSHLQPEHSLGHRIIAVLESLPVFGLLFALIEKVVAWVFCHAVPLNRTPPILSPVKKVPLQKASQYDMPGDQPPACTFHAISALQEISNRFDEVFAWIAEKDTPSLSQFQKGIIWEQGLPLYERALREHPTIAEGADFEQAKEYLPDGVQLTQPEDDERLQPFNDRLEAVIHHLFLQNGSTKKVWIKNGNEESFAIVAKEERAILFDSHKNEIIGTTSKEAARAVLREKLSPYSAEIDGNDVTPFAYAVGLATADEDINIS